MAEIIRAVYEHGRLRPLDPLALMDGQEVHLAIRSEQEEVRSALADLLAPVNTEPADEMDAAALVATIDAALQGSPVSEVLLTERLEGP